MGDLGGLDHFSWAVTAYLLTMAASTPVWGKLGDLYGRKGACLSSVTLFLVGTVLCGLAQNTGQLIAFRGTQGLGAGGLMVGALSVIGVVVPAQDHGRVQSTVGVMMPVAFVGGPCSARTSRSPRPPRSPWSSGWESAPWSRPP